MSKPSKTRDDSELPPKRAKAQQEREADFVASLGWQSTPTRDELDNEIQAQLRILRSEQETLRAGKLSVRDRDRLEKQVAVRIARVETLRKLKG
jgi:polyhydroxyalkanoate synthesis regulator phasin